MNDPINPITLDQDASLPSAFYRASAACPEGVVYRQPIPEGFGGSDGRQWRAWTFREVEKRVNKIAAYLHAQGVRKGTKVAILSNTRPEWLEADMAVLACGGVVVSVYQSLPAHEVGYILFDSGAEIVFAENQEQLGKLLHLLSNHCQIPATEERAAREAKISLRRIITFEAVEKHELVVGLRELLLGSDPGSPEEWKDLRRSDLATLVYTSGTTGPPKGVMQTHGNHLSNVRQAFRAGMYAQGMRIFLLLPLAHSFARLMGAIAFLTGAELAFPRVSDKLSSKAEPQLVMNDMRHSESQIIPLVPRLLEKMKDKVESQARRSGLAAKILQVTISSARTRFLARSSNTAYSPLAWLGYVMSASIRRKISRQIFGMRFRNVISGGAKLPPEVNQFFAALGITILEGYGLTETCVATNVNRLDDNRIGTVGPVLDTDIEVRIAEDGEILFRGPNVTNGYFGRSQATAAAWDGEGWFHTGDLGALDSDGYLSIVGRKKEIIVSSNGKKVAPEPIEQKLCSSPFISQAVLFGDAQPHCVALLGINQHSLESWAKEQGHTLDSKLADDTRVMELLWREVEAVNASLAGFEQVKRIGLLDEELTVENGFLTPTFKLKRRLVFKKYERKIAALYGSS
ncbi:MAG: long-chain fatty acid--CoA ligase [Oligoflexia bacterium]|nr:long-chain fatty acid--CoA ligase [Oligoflexia bacterium]